MWYIIIGATQCVGKCCLFQLHMNDITRYLACSLFLPFRFTFLVLLADCGDSSESELSDDELELELLEEPDEEPEEELLDESLSLSSQSLQRCKW